MVSTSKDRADAEELRSDAGHFVPGACGAHKKVAAGKLVLFHVELTSQDNPKHPIVRDHARHDRSPEAVSVGCVLGAPTLTRAFRMGFQRATDAVGRPRAVAQSTPASRRAWGIGQLPRCCYCLGLVEDCYLGFFRRAGSGARDRSIEPRRDRPVRSCALKRKRATARALGR